MSPKRLTGERIRAPWIDALGVTVYVVDWLPEGVEGRINRTGTEIYVNKRYPENLIPNVLHEMEHIRQVRKVPVPVLNVITSGLAYLAGTATGAIKGDPYWKNPLEASAEAQASRFERRVSAEQAARRIEQRSVRQQQQQTGEFTAEEATLISRSPTSWKDLVRKLLPGVDFDLIKQRTRAIWELAPEGVRHDAEALWKWYQSLNRYDKVYAMLDPGQPLFRDYIIAVNEVAKDPRIAAFYNTPENLWWAVARAQGGRKKGTPEQEAFWSAHMAEIDRRVFSGEAGQVYWGKTAWEQTKIDLLASVPLLTVQLAGRAAGVNILYPGDVVLREVAGPVFAKVKQGLAWAWPAAGRLLMRTSEAVADKMVNEVLGRIRSLEKQIGTQAITNLIEKAKPVLTSLRQSWLDLHRQKYIIYANARDVVRMWGQKFGLNENHWLAAERILAEKDHVWQESVDAVRSKMADMDTLRAQFAAATEPQAKANLQTLITNTQGEILVLNQKYAAQLSAMTPRSIMDAMGVKWADKDYQKVADLLAQMKSHFDSLYPPGKTGYRPFYYPEPETVLKAEIQRARELPFTTQWWLIERHGSEVSLNGAEAIEKFVWRTAGPELVTAAGLHRQAYIKFIDGLASQLDPIIGDTLTSRLKGASVALPTGTVDRDVIDVAKRWVLGTWRNAVLAGRFLPWVTINTLGNITNSAMYVLDNWMRGRFVNPIKAFSDMKVPLYVMEAFGREVKREGQGRVAALLGRLYGVNAWVESAFRGGIYRVEWDTVTKELAAKGIRPDDIPQLASRIGWDKVDEYLYNYGDQYWGSKFAKPLAPFITYRVENIQFWMREFAQKPWLLRALTHFVQARPELNVPVGQFLGFLKNLGIDDRTIDVASKFNFFDFINTVSEQKPKWVKEREVVLSNDLTKALETYRGNPVGLQAYLKQRPELKAYYDYAMQSSAARMLDFSFMALGTNFIGDDILRRAGVQKAREYRGGIFPQQRLFGLILGELGREFGIDFAAKWSDPTDSQLRVEKQLMKALGLSTGDDVKDTELARERWVARNLLDASIDLGIMSGTFRSKILDDLHKEVKDTLGSAAGVNFAPEPERVYRLMEQYRIPVEWASIFARREQIRDVEVSTPEQRKQRQVAFDRLSQEVQNLIKTSGSPEVTQFWTTVNDAFDRWENMDPADKRRFLQDDSVESRLVRAMLGTRYTALEKVVVEQVEGMFPAERKSWYYTAKPDQRELFRQLYPNESAAYDQEENKGIPPNYLAPPAPGSSVPPSPMPYPSRDPKDIGFTAGVQPPRQTADAPPPTGPAPSRAAVKEPLFTANLAAEAIASVETGGKVAAMRGQAPGVAIEDTRYRALSYKANTDKKGMAQGYALGKYQFLPQTLIDLGYGKYLDSQNPADYMDPGRAKQLAARFLADPKVQDRAMQDSIRANAQVLGLGDGPYTSEQVGWLGVAHFAGAGAAKGYMKNPAAMNTGGDGGTTAATYAAKVKANLTTPGKPTPASASVRQMAPAELYARRKVSIGNESAKGGLFIEYPSGLLEAMKAYAMSVNPDLDPKVAERIVRAVHDLYANPANAGLPELKAKSFDPLWVMAMIAEQTGFDPNYNKGGRQGIFGLIPSLYEDLTKEEVFDPVKAVKAAVVAFTDAQRKFGTKDAVERFGGNYEAVRVRATDILGLQPVAVSPFDRTMGKYVLLSPPDTEREHKFAELYYRLVWAGGNPEDPAFLSKRRDEWAVFAKQAEPWQLDLLREHFPDLYFSVKAAAEGKTPWFLGKAVLERGDREYIEWKHKVLGAESLDKAVEAYKSGTEQYQRWFAYNNGDMAAYFTDYLSGVARDYRNWEFSDAQDVAYLDSRRKLAVALATGSVATIKQAVSDITSIYGADVSGFMRKLKTDTPMLFESVKSYMGEAAYGADEKLKVRQYLQGLNHLMEEYRRTGNPEALEVAAAQWSNPENAGLKNLVFEHETDQFDNIERRLAGVPSSGHFVNDENYVSFQRFANDLQTAYQTQDAGRMRQLWEQAPDSYRKEFQAYHQQYYDYEPVLNNEDPQAWVARREKELAAPYAHYLRMDDAYGAYSPEKLQKIAEESPGAFNYIMADPEERQNMRAAWQGRLSGLYTGVLRQYNYNPALLNAIPDDGTRHMMSLLDPNAAEAFRIHGVPVTQTSQPVIPSMPTIQTIYGEGSTVDPVLDEQGQPTGSFKVTRFAPGAGGVGGPQEIVVSSDQLATQFASLTKMPTASPQFRQLQDQFRVHQGISSALQLVYRGVQISNQGGDFLQQLPQYYQAAQTAAAAGLFTGNSASFLLGPTGLLVGGLLGIFGQMFQTNPQVIQDLAEGAVFDPAEFDKLRQRLETTPQFSVNFLGLRIPNPAFVEIEEAIKAAEKTLLRQRPQLEAQSAALRESIRRLTSQQLEEVDRRSGGAVRRFTEQPTAITQTALFNALVAPRPNW